MDYLSTIWEFLNGSFVSSAFNAGTSVLLSELINKWNNRKNKKKKDFENFLNENYDNVQIKVLAEEINKIFFQVSQNNYGGINIIAPGSVNISNSLETEKTANDIGEEDVEQEIRTRFGLYKLDIDNKPYPPEMIKLINNEIDGEYYPGIVYRNILDIFAKYITFPVVDRRLMIEKEVRENYECSLPKDLLPKIKNEIFGIADESYYQAVDTSTLYTIEHIIKRYPGCGYDYKIQEYEKDTESQKRLKPTRVYKYIELKLDLIEVELKKYGK